MMVAALIVAGAAWSVAVFVGGFTAGSYLATRRHRLAVETITGEGPNGAGE